MISAVICVTISCNLRMEKKWYVVHTLSGQEHRVKEMLQNTIESQGLQEFIPEILIPTENVSEVKGGKKIITTRKFFPGYILINMAFTEDTWYVVKQTPGTIGFVGSGSPVPLQEEEIKDILEQIEAKKEKVKPKVIFETLEFPKHERLRVYYEANAKCKNYFAFMNEHDPLLLNLFYVLKSILRYDFYHLPSHIIWCFKNFKRIVLRIVEKINK